MSTSGGISPIRAPKEPRVSTSGCWGHPRPKGAARGQRADVGGIRAPKEPRVSTSGCWGQPPIPGQATTLSPLPPLTSHAGGVGRDGACIVPAHGCKPTYESGHTTSVTCTSCSAPSRIMVNVIVSPGDRDCIDVCRSSNVSIVSASTQ